jgi:hypothetical protein
MTDLTDLHRNTAQTLHFQHRINDRPDSHRTADQRPILTDHPYRADTALPRLCSHLRW